VSPPPPKTQMVEEENHLFDWVIRASMAITEEMLRKWGSMDGMTQTLWGEGPLEYLIPTLSSLPMTISQEFKAMETTKSKQKVKMVCHQLPKQASRSDTERPCTPSEMQPRFPKPLFQTPVN
jgi:hypothetical protein